MKCDPEWVQRGMQSRILLACLLICFPRVINTGLHMTYYPAADRVGGMVHKTDDLPAFWKDAAAGQTYAEADCSPAMKEVAARLFRHGRPISTN
jgi:hypothetical protein